MSCPCIPGPVASVVTWAAYSAQLKAWLCEEDLDPLPSDFTLQAMLEAGAATADQVIGCTFDCDCDGTPVIPTPVILGVFSWVKSSVSGSTSGADVLGSVRSVKTGDLSVTYGDSGYSTTDAAMAAAKAYWRPYICNPLR